MLWLVLAALPAAAQQGGFDAHGFRFASADADLRDPLTFLRPGDQFALDTSFGIVGEYAMRPLVFEPYPDQREVWLENLVAVNVAAGIAVAAPVRLGLELPVVITSASPAAGIAAQPASLGDIRASGMVTFVQPRNGDHFGLAVEAHVGFPTGAPDQFFGEGGLSSGAALLATVEGRVVTASWRIGARFNPGNPPSATQVRTKGGDMLEGAFALGVLATRSFSFGVEGNTAWALDPSVRTAIGVPGEGMLTARYVHPQSGWFVTGGVGTALGAGAGSSPVRAVFGGGIGLGGRALPDADLDGVADVDDGCPDQAETSNNYEDDDGCPDYLPKLTFTPELPESQGGEATISVSSPSQGRKDGIGILVVEAMPGEVVTAEAEVGDCVRGSIQVQPNEEPEQWYRVPVARVVSTTKVTVTDSAGRQLPGASIRYLVDNPLCAPANADLRDGAGTHEVGVGKHGLLITADGYDIYQGSVLVEPGEEAIVAAVLSPTQVQFVAGELTLGTAFLFEEGSSLVSDRSRSMVSQIATVMLTHDLSVRFTGHPDADGSGGRQLAWSRVEALQRALVQQGVPADRITTNGAATPLADGHVSVSITKP